ncbi:MAG: hypothetical protein V3T23_02090 [Nitrososphaerales archaeon]
MLSQRKIPYHDHDLEKEPIRGEEILKIIAGKKELYLWREFDHSKSAEYFLLEDPMLSDEDKLSLLIGERSGRLRSGTLIIGDTVISGVKLSFLEMVLQQRKL